ncbi:hypothetical protein DFJ58DRAFT_835890 [Suillus subalutaceus]|uniref:uncharacterized protein n=1 Tax=Suillus subalutaceus TaxID=48586 RepID=UPI001B861C3B|nr:uncharacterized protein DFJ58DRAFT_835890 [Suillus subalutaceus]KAG1876581.1 hypothetical protein DFJ58DRAFT_835890 [Suillus subalutaceus]
MAGLINELQDGMRHACTYFLTTAVMILAPSYLPQFNSSAIHNGMCPKWLDFYIRLIPMKTASLQFLKYHFRLNSRSASTGTCSTSIGAYSAAVQHKCETWLRGQDPNFILTPSLKSIGPSFHLSSTWVPPGVQEALDKACHLELHSQAGLVAMYLDILEGYHSHQCNPELELHHLHVKMCCAKAEVEVYELAIENVPASNYSDSNTALKGDEAPGYAWLNGFTSVLFTWTFYKLSHTYLYALSYWLP